MVPGDIVEDSQIKVSKTPKKKIKKGKKSESGEDGGKKRAKRVKKSIFISYSPDASYKEKRFTANLVQQLKENNLADDLWFDKDEAIIDDVSWLSKRLDTAEKCKAAVLIISKSYLSCNVTNMERKILSERIRTEESEKKPLIFCIILEPVDFTRSFTESLLSVSAELVDLTGGLGNLSVEEKTSFAMGALCDRLYTIASMKTPYIPPRLQSEADGTFQQKRVVEWNTEDVVQWLYSIRVSEFFRESFAEQRVDGFLLLATTDQDIHWNIGVDSRSARKKVSSELLEKLKSEQSLADSWHLRCRLTRPRRDLVYIVYDPQDARLATNLKRDISRRGLQVLSHDKLGQSRKEFLELNCPTLAKCSNVICLITEAGGVSPFVYQEVLFARWLGGKRTVTHLMFSNVWQKLKPSMKAAIGDSPAIDFETKLFSESMDILEHHIKPQPNLTGVVLDDTFVAHLNDGVQTMKALCTNSYSIPAVFPDDDHSIVELPKVFLSYQWDAQNKALQIAEVLEQKNLTCWSDVTMTPRSSMSRMSLRSSQTSGTDVGQNESLQSHIHRNMKLSQLVICCLTPKYITSKNCEQDLTLAATLNKKILLVMLQFVPWPPDGISEQIRRILVTLDRPIDLSNDKLLRSNIHTFVKKVAQSIS